MAARRVAFRLYRAATTCMAFAFDADVYLANTHKTDGVLYGLQPANATAAQLMDNAYIGNMYRAAAVLVGAVRQEAPAHPLELGQPADTSRRTTTRTRLPPRSKYWLRLPRRRGDVPERTRRPSPMRMAIPSNWLWGAIEAAKNGHDRSVQARATVVTTTPRRADRRTYYMPRAGGELLYHLRTYYPPPS